MTETVASTADNVVSTVDTTLIALRAKEEQACAGYLAAHKAMKHAVMRAASMRQLSLQQPSRVDYREAYNKALDDFNAACERTRLAYNRWQRAQLRYDARWTDTEGRSAGAA